jgi:short-subunit dehydrogenase
MFRKSKKQTALITGASSGIGEATAIALNKKGFVVYAAARRVERMKHLADKGIKTISLDVTDEESMMNCLRQIENESGMLDILINNAGYGSYGSFEETPMTEARNQMEVNVFGLARLSQLVIPKMRDAKKAQSLISRRLVASWGRHMAHGITPVNLLLKV